MNAAKVLLAGGTGFVGRRVAAQLAASGLSLRLLMRDPARVSPSLAASAELAPGDVTDARSLLPAVQGVQVVVHLVGIINESWGRSFRQVHVEGTRNIVAACREAGISRYLHMSALGARADARSRYHRTKWEAEEIVRASGLPYTIFRPSIIYGEGDQFINRFITIIRKSPIIPVMGDGLGLLQPIWVEDIAACFAQSLSNPATSNQAYEIGGPEALGLVEIMELLRRRIAPGKPLLHFPLSLMRPVAKLLELLPNPPVTNEQLTMLQEDNVCELEPIQRAFQLSGKRLGTYLDELVGGATAEARGRR